MNAIPVTLEMPIQLGRVVISSPVVQASLDDNLDVKVRPRRTGSERGNAYRDFGTTTLLVLGTPSAVAAVTGVFSVIRTVIKEAHKTRREHQGQDHEMRKLVLILGTRRSEIDLDGDLVEIETHVEEFEREAIEQATALSGQ